MSILHLNLTKKIVLNFPLKLFDSELRYAHVIIIYTSIFFALRFDCQSVEAITSSL